MNLPVKYLVNKLWPGTMWYSRMITKQYLNGSVGWVYFYEEGSDMSMGSFVGRETTNMCCWNYLFWSNKSKVSLTKTNIQVRFSEKESLQSKFLT